MSEDRPEPDRIEGAPHPRETPVVFGQDAARADFLDAFNAGRLHSGWLVTGPRGIGKSTLAWKIATFLLAEPADDGLFGGPAPAENLNVGPDHPDARLVQSGAHPRLFVVRRPVDEKTNKLKSEITVDAVRGLKGFFHMSAADGGRRVVIVDAADDMNISAANALLKMLEEPPARTTLLLISHQPSALLPTIRSRCRTLRLGPLSADDMTAALIQAGATLPDDTSHLAALAGGSVGAALRMLNLGGLEMYRELVGILDTLPRLDRPRALRLAEAAAQRGAAERFELLLTLMELARNRLARTGATGHAPQPEAAQGESAMLARLSPNAQKARDWADTAARTSARARHGQAVNLDPAALVLDTVFKIQETAAG
jgi:DNA polymerase-3 subunit delta'